MTFCFRRFARFRDLLCFFLITLSACSKTDNASGDTDASAPAATGNRSLDSDLEQLQDFKLSMPRMQKWVQAQRNLVALSKARPDLEGSYQVEKNASIDQQVAALEGHADVRKAVRDAGVSPREFTLTPWGLHAGGHGALGSTHAHWQDPRLNYAVAEGAPGKHHLCSEEHERAGDADEGDRKVRLG